MNPQSKLMVTDDNQNKTQVFPQTDMASVIGLKAALAERDQIISDLTDRISALENRVLYH